MLLRSIAPRFFLALTLCYTLSCRGQQTAEKHATAPRQTHSSSSVNLPNGQVNHVFIVMEENHGYTDVIGSPSMPYLNSLASAYSVAQGYYANTHPSIGNYFMLTTGQIITNDDGYTATVTVDNVVRELIAAGKTWKEYSEALPHQGYYGGDMGEYSEHHNPLSYMSDVRNNPAQQQNLVPFTQLAIDIADHNLPNYAFIVPDLLDDAHDGSLAQADAWLQANIAPLLASPDFTGPNGGMLIITFDEAEDSDLQGGGGHVGWVAIGPDANRHYPPSGSQTPVKFYQHQSTCRFMMKLAGVSVFPGAAATAPDMYEFFVQH